MSRYLGIGTLQLRGGTHGGAAVMQTEPENDVILLPLDISRAHPHVEMKREYHITVSLENREASKRPEPLAASPRRAGHGPELRAQGGVRRLGLNLMHNIPAYISWQSSLHLVCTVEMISSLLASGKVVAGS